MSLTAPYDNANVFAKILRGEIPCARVYEDDTTLSFMDAFPQTRGHTLVIPKATAVNLFDVSPEILSDLVVKTQTVARAVRDALSPDGVRLMQFNGAAGGQSVFHIHFHILPMWDDTGVRPHAAGQMADLSELKEMAALIRAKL